MTEQTASAVRHETPVMNDEPRAPLRRVVGLFRPYRGRLAVVGALIGLSSLVSLASPFMLRSVLDDAIPHGRTGLLTLLALGMVAVAVVTSVLDVVQTLISTGVGQRVMHDLRTSVYGHLQRMSMAFFTRTRTGEVQSRIASDIGGMQLVVTSTAASMVSCRVVVMRRRSAPTRRVRTTKSGSRAREKTARRQSRTNIAMTLATTVVTFATMDVAVEVTTFWTPPMSLAMRDCTSPVRVRVKNASDSRWRCR